MSTAAATPQALDAALSAANPATPSTGVDNLPPLSSTSLEDLEKHFSGETNLLPEVDVETDAVTAPIPPTEIPVDPADDKRPSRISTAQFSDTDWQAIAALKEMRAADPNATMADALALVASKPATTPVVEPETVQLPSSDALATELQALDAELDVHAENEGLLTKDVLNKIRKREELIGKLNSTRHQEAIQQTEAQNRAISERSKSKDIATQLFPSVAVEGSAMHRKTAEIVAQMREGTHPDADVLRTVNAPKLIAQMAADAVATDLAKAQGISYSQAYASLMGQTTANPPSEQKRAITAGGHQGQDPKPPTTSVEQLLASPDGFNIAELDSAYEQSYGKSKGLIIGLG